MRVRFFSGKGLVTALVVVATVLMAGTGTGAGPKKVAVFPFTMNSPQDLGFLQNGLFSMLSSRLADPGKVEVLDRETVDQAMAKAQTADLTKGALNEDKARMIGAEMGVDYILFGSLTNFGESVSLDASMVDVTGEKKTLSFFEQSNSMGDVIPLVNAFAGDVNEKVFDRKINNELYVQPEPQEAPAPGSFQHAGGAAVFGGGMMATQSAADAFIMNLKYDGIITAMAVGDLNNDGRNQVVAATDSTLMIYTLKGTMLTLEKTLDYKDYLRIVGLDVADINGNGYPEIFVTALTIHRESLASFVVEYNGTTFATLVDDEADYYRVMTTPDDTKVLMGQSKGEHPFNGRIYIMAAQGDGYTREKRIRMPRGASVLSMSQGPATGEGSSDYVYINEHSRLVVADNGGGLVWESSEKYGLTNNVWLMPKVSSEEVYRERKYLNPRTLFYDIGQDGTKEVLLIKNEELGGGTFGQYKRFTKGHIQVMKWNGMGLGPVFQTVPVQGWISDMAIADLDGDGADELIVSVVTRSKLAILSKDKASNIISYKLK